MNLASPTSAAVCAVVAGLVLRSILLFSTPYKQAEIPGELSAYNDEPAHVAYTLHVLATGELPRRATPIQESLRDSLPEFENYQSPLYYVLHAAACKTLNVEAERGVMLVGRALSMLCMIGVFVIGISLARAADLNQDQIALAVILLALGAVFVRFSVQAGNEMLAWLAGGALCAAYVRVSSNGKPRDVLSLAALFVVGLYVKLSLLALAPLLLLGLYRSWKSGLHRAVALSLLVLLLTVPLFARNHMLFGDVIPIAAGFGAPEFMTPNLLTLTFALRSLVFPWSELWHGWLGLALMLPALALTAAFVWRFSQTLRQHTWQSLLLCSAVFAFVALNFRYQQAEGRYLLIAWPAVVTSVAVLPRRLARPWLVVLILSLPYLLFVV